MKNEGTRQVHLDFHTSEDIPDVGSQFDESQFQAALKAGHVDHINVFAKCHHSWSYYPTTVGRPHPSLATDLLGRQIEAAHQIGVIAPIYFTGGWSALDAEDHPDWCMRTIDGGFVVENWPIDARPDDPKPTFQWKELCVTGEYHDLIMTQVEEICKKYPVDGYFFDIYRPQLVCYCDRCRAGMSRAGKRLDDLEAVEEYRAGVVISHAQALRGLIHTYHPNASIFFNGTTALERPQNFRHRVFAVNTKNDLEDLPTTWGGYEKLPLRARIFHREGTPIVAMSGKFHTAWGEFGGFKAPEALRYEAAAMIANGVRCNFGDHLHPLGRMDETTYANIGHAYSYVEKIEEYGIGGIPASSLGVVPSYEIEADEGLARMLLEEQLDFDVVGAGDDLSRFQTLVVPSQRGILEPFESALRAFLSRGGQVVVLGEGLLTAAGQPAAIPSGVTDVRESEFDMDYTQLSRALLDDAARQSTASCRGHRLDLPATPFLNYRAGLRIGTDGECDVRATVEDPYFSRTYGHYCGHQNTPNAPGSNGSAAVWRRGGIVGFAHNLDRMYYRHGAKVHRDLFSSVVREVHTAAMVEASLPSLGRVSLLHQADERRYVAHLLYGPPTLRGNCLVIEDLPELRDVRVRLRLPVTVSTIRLIPDEQELNIEVVQATDGTAPVVEVVVPGFAGHCALAASY